MVHSKFINNIGNMYSRCCVHTVLVRHVVVFQRSTSCSPECCLISLISHCRGHDHLRQIITMEFHNQDLVIKEGVRVLFALPGWLSYPQAGGGRPEEEAGQVKTFHLKKIKPVVTTVLKIFITAQLQWQRSSCPDMKMPFLNYNTISNTLKGVPSSEPDRTYRGCAIQHQIL